MKKNESIKQSTLASYAVMKALTDSNEYNNSYGILADFIRYIIMDRKWHKFSIIDLSNELQTEFGFDNIPIPAIRTSLKQIKECIKKGNEYIISPNTYFLTDTFLRIKQFSSSQSQSITQKLFEYANEQFPKIHWNDSLEEAFIKYLLDDAATIDQKYTDVISKFILKYENDENIQKQIVQIREGSILYCGLAYNISELGSITTDLTLFLDTEVLFNIVGFNGSLYQQIAEDFLNQVKIANAKKKKIRLRYFNDVKLEIEGFFNTAENIIRGNGDLITSTAMKYIVNGCNTVGDIRDKESDFFYQLKTKYEILPDEKQSYYDADDHIYNIETIPDEFPNDDRSYEAVKFISHINKLRKGENSKEYTTCKYLLVTETRRIQEISNAMKPNVSECGYVLPTSVITNILWFKLGCGFSKKEYPKNTDASFKARSILASDISNNITRLYEETRKQYKEGIIDQDQVASRIILMRDKNRTPEEITIDSVNELLDFTPEYIEKYEDGVKQNRILLKEKQDIIEKLEAAKSAGDEQNLILKKELERTKEERDNSKSKVDEQNETIKKQNEELDSLRDAENNRIARKNCWKRLGTFVLTIIIYGVCFFGALFIICKILKYFSPEISENIKLLFDGASILISLIAAIIHAWKKVYGKDKKSEEDSGKSQEKT